MKAIILAAGLGTRLKPLTDSMPKCLTEVNGKSILVNMLENLEDSGVKETIIVIGYLGNKIKEIIGNKIGNMRINYVKNDIYDRTNTSYSLWLVLKDIKIDDYLLILEGDVFFERRLLEKFLEQDDDNSTVVQRYNPSLDGSFIEINNGMVNAWLHKNLRYRNFYRWGKFKTVNIHKFNNYFVESFLKIALKNHIEASAGKGTIEQIMHEIVNVRGFVISIFEVGDIKWVEIDDLNDLKIAETLFQNNNKDLNKQSFIAVNTKMEKPSLDEVRSFHGGYWRQEHIDFHYLFNHHFPTPEMYKELAEKMSIIGNYYPSSQKILAKLLAKWKDEPYFTADNLIVANGSSELIRYMNDHVITKVTVPLPTFNEFVRIPDKKLHKYLLKEEENFVLDADKLIEEIKNSGSEFAVIINPNNPVGNLTPLKDIEKILKTGVTLIVDEAFMAFAGKQYSAEQLIPKYKNLVIIASCTKSIGIAGLRLGYLLSSNEDIKAKIQDHMPIWNVNSLAEYVIEILPKYKKEHEESIVKSIADTKWFFEALKSISYLKPFPTHANAVFCKVDGSARKLAEILYNKYNLMVKEGLNQKDFKTDSYVRLGVRNKIDNQKLLDALLAIKKEDISPNK